jgi:hypothetical protein
VSRLERLSALLSSLDLGACVEADGRTFAGPAEALKRLAALEELAKALRGTDLAGLYARRIAHDGVHVDDIYHSGRYYAYFEFELKGMTPEEKRAGLSSALAPLVERFGADEVLGRFPERIKGRQVTEDLSIRPENEDFPSYYSAMRTSYAEKMAAEELPKAIVGRVREEADAILDKYSWTSLFVPASGSIPAAGKGSELVDLCGNAYLIPTDKKRILESLSAVWEDMVSGGVDKRYDVAIAHDGEYPKDDNNPFGRYYAYVRASLRGTGSEERRKMLVDSLPQPAVKEFGAERIASAFPEAIEGDPVTKPLTLRPEADDFPSYYSKQKVEAGLSRARKQILINVEAGLISLADEALGGSRKLIILE